MNLRKIKPEDLIGFGTWLMKHDEVDVSIKAAIENGYKLIDTAQIYNNEYQIGEALKKYDPEQKMFITTKVWPANFKAHTYESIKESTRRLGRKINLMIMHATYNKEVDAIAYKELMKARDEGLVDHIGVSNFMITHLEDLYESVGEWPENNQINISPVVYSKELIEFCKSKDISITSYSTLRPYLSPWQGASEMTDEQKAQVNAIAKNHGVSGANVVLRWAMQHGMLVIPKSKNPDRVKANINLTSFELSKDEMTTFDNMRDKKVSDWTSWSNKEVLEGLPENLLFDKNYESKK